MQYMLCRVNYFIALLHAKIMDIGLILSLECRKGNNFSFENDTFLFFKMAVFLLQYNRLRITVNQKMKIICVTSVMVLQPNEEYFIFSDDGNTRRNLQGSA